MSGHVPSVSDAARHAEISPATAYRYFASQVSLLSEAALASYAGQVEEAVDEGQAGGDLESGLRSVVQAVHTQLAQNEVAWRKLLGQSLDLPPTEGLRFELERGVGRQGRRVRWFRDVLSPLHDRVSAQAFDTLVVALTATAGLEAMCALRDVCGLSLDETARVQEWAAVALLRQVMAEWAEPDFRASGEL